MEREGTYEGKKNRYINTAEQNLKRLEGSVTRATLTRAKESGRRAFRKGGTRGDNTNRGAKRRRGGIRISG